MPKPPCVLGQPFEARRASRASGDALLLLTILAPHRQTKVQAALRFHLVGSPGEKTRSKLLDRWPVRRGYPVHHDPTRGRAGAAADRRRRARRVIHRRDGRRRLHGTDGAPA